MSKIYIAKSGDTLSRIAQLEYGDSSEYPRIFNANNLKSGDPNIIFVGEKILIPDIPSETKIVAIEQIESSGINDVSIVVDEKTIVGFRDVSLVKTMDTAADGFSFSINWDPENQEIFDLFKPFQYSKTQLYIGGELKLNGRIEKITPELSANSRTLRIEARSLTAALIDCSIDVYPLEYNNQTLPQIANALLEPFGIDSIFPDGNGAKFEKVRAENSQSPFNFLNGLAKQRGFVISSTNKGNLLFWRAKTTGDIKANIIEGLSPWVGGSVDYDGTKRFSSYTALGQSSGQNNKKAVIADDSINVYRPLVFTASDGDKGNIEDSAKWKRSLSYVETLQPKIQLSRWRDEKGNLFEENTKITLLSPSYYIQNTTEFLIKNITYSLTNSSRTVDIDLILPAAYNLDEELINPWD